MGTVRVGLSGWSYDEWDGGFYPDDLPDGERLAFVAQRFATVEVNGTFYSLTTPDAVRGWRDAAPSSFRFAVKGSRYITHMRRLDGVEGALANFFAAGVLDLGAMLGPVLWQLPDTLEFEGGLLDRFLDLLPADTEAARRLARDHDDRVESPSFGPDENHRVRHVLEVRHDSWFCEEAVRILRDHGVALAFSHATDWPYVEEVTAGFVYLRLHGPDEPYASAYGEAVENWADRIRRWHQAEEPDDAVRITDRAPPRRRERDVYVYFDNDVGGHAPRDARRLREVLG
ncbi:MAG: DUF72 domain-containing protein [Acidimicrobiia bacterium]|nr:DUF72 domain-containing protein [Acidimicrobiia bacterium]